MSETTNVTERKPKRARSKTTPKKSAEAAPQKTVKTAPKATAPRAAGKTKKAGAKVEPRGVVGAEERQRMIAEAAYYRALGRGFVGGSPEEDWLAAEAEIAALLGSPAG